MANLWSDEQKSHQATVKDKIGNPKVALHWEHYIKQIRDKYNKTHSDKISNVTLNTYTHFQYEDAEQEVLRLSQNV